jgi:hypothetical protein
MVIVTIVDMNKILLNAMDVLVIIHYHLKILALIVQVIAYLVIMIKIYSSALLVELVLEYQMVNVCLVEINVYLVNFLIIKQYANNVGVIIF